ncbi:Succinyl-CoA:(R)-benzylsuccinate CoA-transferase subunit BbsF [compost metagenome]
MLSLQQAGVSAGVVKPIWSVLDDPHLRGRGFFRKVQRAHLGEYLATTPWFRESQEPLEIRRVAPTLGEHSREVFARVTGLTGEQVDALESSGITGTVATRKRA